MKDDLLVAFDGLGKGFDVGCVFAFHCATRGTKHIDIAVELVEQVGLYDGFVAERCDALVECAGFVACEVYDFAKIL